MSLPLAVAGIACMTYIYPISFSTAVTIGSYAVTVAQTYYTVRLYIPYAGMVVKTCNFFIKG